MNPVLLVFLTFVLMTILIGIRLPVAIALGIGGLVLQLGLGIPFQPNVVALKMMYGINSFTVLAITFYVLLGRLISHDAIWKRFFNLVHLITGWWKGGELHFDMIFNGAFGALSGSSVSNVVGPGRLIYKMEREAGYDESISAATTATSAVLSVIIPPSIPLILWGYAGNVSIGKLWAGAVFPGILLIGLLCSIVYILSHLRNYPVGKRPQAKQLMEAFVNAIPILAVPAIIWGGVFGGIFTPTEAAVVAVVYVTLIFATVYRKEITLREYLYETFQATKDAASILFIVATATYFGWVFAYSGIPAEIAEFVASFAGNSPRLFLLFVTIVFLILSCFMETISLILIFAPVITKSAMTIGVDPVLAGVVSTLAIVAGQLTPPFGILLFVTQRTTGVPVEKMVKDVIKFFPALVGVILLVILFPSLVTYLPSLIQGS